jgi:hypothetical protein
VTVYVLPLKVNVLPCESVAIVASPSEFWAAKPYSQTRPRRGTPCS